MIQFANLTVSGIRSGFLNSIPLIRALPVLHQRREGHETGRRTRPCLLMGPYSWRSAAQEWDSEKMEEVPTTVRAIVVAADVKTHCLPP